MVTLAGALTVSGCAKSSDSGSATSAGPANSTAAVAPQKVDDIAATIDALTAKGVTFAVYEGFGQDAQGVWTDPGSGTKIAWFHDPEGNNLSLTQFG